MVHILVHLLPPDASQTLCEMLERNSIQTLWLSVVFLGVGALITSTLEHCTVTDQNSVVSDSDMESFAAMLASKTSLKHLDLGGNWFQDTI